MKSLKRVHVIGLLAVAATVVFSAASADLREGFAAYKRGDYETADHEFSRLAEEGDPIAEYGLALMYSKGRGVPQDNVIAADLYRSAAEQGVLEAQVNLAVMYMEGQGVSQDYWEAARWYKEPAEHGFRAAMNGLADIAFESEGAAVGYDEALYWLKEIAKTGDPDGLEGISWMYLNGVGVERDIVEMFAWTALATCTSTQPNSVMIALELAKRMTEEELAEGKWKAKLHNDELGMSCSGWDDFDRLIER